jgi:hypothetical protein
MKYSNFKRTLNKLFCKLFFGNILTNRKKIDKNKQKKMYKIFKKIIKYTTISYIGVSSPLLLYGYFEKSNSFYLKTKSYVLPFEGIFVRAPKTIVICLYVYLIDKFGRKYYKEGSPEFSELRKRNAITLKNLFLTNGGTWIKLVNK